MDGEIIFRKAGFGGFNRADVTDYIVKQKNKLFELENEKKSLSSEIDNLKTEKENLSGEYEEKISLLENDISELKIKLENAEKENASDNDYDLLNKQYEEKIFEANAKDKIIEELQSKLAVITAENEKIKTELASDSKKEVELKVGSAMLDVRKFADMVIEEAEEKIDSMELSAVKAADATQSRLKDITLGIRVFADKLNNIIDDVLKDAEALDGDMNVFTQYFEQPKKALSGYKCTENGENNVD